MYTTVMIITFCATGAVLWCIAAVDIYRLFSSFINDGDFTSILNSLYPLYPTCGKTSPTWKTWDVWSFYNIALLVVLCGAVLWPVALPLLTIGAAAFFISKHKRMQKKD